MGRALLSCGSTAPHVHRAVIIEKCDIQRFYYPDEGINIKKSFLRMNLKRQRCKLRAESQLNLAL